MKNIKLICLLIFSIVNIGVYGQYFINADTTWLSDSLFISNDIIIGENARLTISAGKVIVFENYSGIEIRGRLTAIGTETDSIIFRVSDTTGFSDTTTLIGGWKGLYFNTNNNTDTSFLKYCNISNGKANGQKSFLNGSSVANKGGGIIIYYYDNVIIGYSTITNNYASFKGAGLYVKSSENVIINKCYISKNKTYEEGGGIYFLGVKGEITNNKFVLNTAYKIDTAGGYYWSSGTGSSIFSSFCSSRNPLIEDNLITGGKGISGTLYDNNSSSLIFNNIIVNNDDIGFFNGHGGSHTKFTNNIICNNSKQSPTNSGATIFSNYLILSNNIIWGNEAGGLNEPPQIFDEWDDKNVTFCCVQYGYSGEGNIDTYPVFNNPTSGAGKEYIDLSADWSLLNFSPCVNTGTPDTTDLNLPEFDIAGNPRIFGGRIDMGAYENQNVYVKINDSPVYSKIKLYPNPGTDKIYIDIPPEMTGAWIDIVDVQGRVLMHEQITYSPAVLSPFKLTAGIYFYRIYNENKVVKSGKWVKR